MPLVRPTTDHLPSYVAALGRGWSPDTMRVAAGQEELLRIAEDPAAFLALLHNPNGDGPPVTLPDGSQVPRLPGVTRWMWAGEFVGSINLRWQRSSAADGDRVLSELPPRVLGHIGYAVVPWQQRQGHAKAALAAMLVVAKNVGLRYVLITCDADNVASQRVILANGAGAPEFFNKPTEFGGKASLRYRIDLS